MDKIKIEKLAEQAGVRFFGGWLEGNQEAIYKFAELIVAEVNGEDYWLWPDGTWCVAGDYESAKHMSDDYTLVRVTEYDDNGEPMFPGGLR